MSYESDISFYEFAESFVADQVKFINLMLQEVRKRDKRCQTVLGDSYGKAIGFTSPFLKCGSELRKVRTDLGVYLATTRMILENDYKRQLKTSKKVKQKQTENHPPENHIRA